MSIPNSRLLNLTGFVVCSGMMAYALYAEYQLLLEPCPLCVFERMSVTALGVVFLIAALQNPQGWGRRIYAFLILLAAGAGIGVASQHVWLQHLPADKVPSCGPGFDYIIDSFPLSDALKLIFSGSGECAAVDWLFMGLSMPAYVLIGLVFMGGLGVWANLRKSV